MSLNYNNKNNFLDISLSFFPLRQFSVGVFMEFSCKERETNARHTKSNYLTNNMLHACCASKAETDVLMPTFLKWAAQCVTALWPRWRCIPRCHSASHVTFLWMMTQRVPEADPILCHRFKCVHTLDLALCLNPHLHLCSSGTHLFS